MLTKAVEKLKLPKCFELVGGFVYLKMDEKQVINGRKKLHSLESRWRF